MATLPNLIRRLIPTRSQSPINLPVYDVTDHAEEFDLEAMAVIKTAPVWMTRAERLLLYTLTFTLRPSRYLEIGTLHGGSALIVNAAMTALGGHGRILCVDPKPQIEPEHMAILSPRTEIITGYSPDALAEAQQKAGGPFDFVLIDGDHTYRGVVRDANGVLPFVTDGAYILFHDSLNSEVARGLNHFAQQHAATVTDFGTMTREVTTQERADAPSLQWGGLRLMQVRRRYQVN